ncbi:MAG: hypothetical protein AAFO29_25155, partial [Actinomycetota bacterium]
SEVVDTWWPPGRPRWLGSYLVDHGDPWVEKTPGHLRRWPELLGFDRHARILVVTRSIPATLVSQSEVDWLSDRSPHKLLARILADRLHLRLLQVAAPERTDLVRYEDFVAAVETLPDSPSAALPHEHWKRLSGESRLVDDRNRAAQQRRPEVWDLGASPARMASALPGAVARVLVDVARSVRALRTGAR